MSSRIDELGIDAEMLVHLGPPARGAHRRVGMGEREMAALGIHHVDVEVDGQVAEQLDRFLVERDALRRQVVGADDRGVAAVLPPRELARSTIATSVMP